MSREKLWCPGRDLDSRQSGLQLRPCGTSPRVGRSPSLSYLGTTSFQEPLDIKIFGLMALPPFFVFFNLIPKLDFLEEKIPDMYIFRFN